MNSLTKIKDALALTESQIPKMYKSLAISMIGIIAGFIFYSAIKYFFPQKDWAATDTLIIGSISPFVVNYFKMVISNQEL